jgi:hypothetical protein
MQDATSRGGFYCSGSLAWQVARCHALHRSLKSQRTVIVCPVVAQGVWRREFAK